MPDISSTPDIDVTKNVFSGNLTAFLSTKANFDGPGRCSST